MKIIKMKHTYQTIMLIIRYYYSIYQKNLNTDIKREIYNKLLTYEIIEITTQGWTELTIQSIQDELYYDMYDLYDDLDIGD